MADPFEALSASLRVLSKSLPGEQTPRQGLLCIAQLGESALEGAKATGVTLLDHGRPKTFAFTRDTAPEVDQLQYAEGSGPCLTSYEQMKVAASPRTARRNAGRPSRGERSRRGC